VGIKPTSSNGAVLGDPSPVSFMRVEEGTHLAKRRKKKRPETILKKRSLHMDLPSLVPRPSWEDEGREPEGNGLRRGEGRHLDRRAHGSGEALGRAQEAAHLKPAKTNTFLRIQGALDGGLGHNLNKNIEDLCFSEMVKD